MMTITFIHKIVIITPINDLSDDDDLTPHEMVMITLLYVIFPLAYKVVMFSPLPSWKKVYLHFHRYVDLWSRRWSTNKIHQYCVWPLFASTPALIWRGTDSYKKWTRVMFFHTLKTILFKPGIKVICSWLCWLEFHYRDFWWCSKPNCCPATLGKDESRNSKLQL